MKYVQSGRTSVFLVITMLLGLGCGPDDGEPEGSGNAVATQAVTACAMATPWGASKAWYTYSVGEYYTHADETWRVINIAYAYLEPGSLFGIYGWQAASECRESCVPETCASLGAGCGAVDDGCGGTLTCGACDSGEICDAANQCVASCVPATCASLGATCGAVNDGCGGTLTCGTCDAGETCGAAKQCVPSSGGACLGLSTWQLGTYSAGAQVQAGGDIYECRPFPNSGWCGVASAYEPGVGAAWPDAWIQLGSCGGAVCIPATCAELGAQCGALNDGCGSMIDCGGCAAGETCSAANTCLPSNNPPPGGAHVRQPWVPENPLIGFFHASFQNGAANTLELDDIPVKWDIINLAFADRTDAQGNVSFSPFYDVARFQQHIATLQAQGKIINLSLGGAEGVIRINSQSEEDHFVSSMLAILNAYGLDGVDVDLESGSDIRHGTPTQQRLPAALRRIRNARVAAGARFFLGFAPEYAYLTGGYVVADAPGSVWGSYLPVIDALRDITDIVYEQNYNNPSAAWFDGVQYPVGTQDYIVATTDLLLSGFPRPNGGMFAGLEPHQVGFGVPASSSAAGTGTLPRSEVMAAYTCLTQRTGCNSVVPAVARPSLGGIMTWSIQWDRQQNADAFATEIGGFLATYP